MFGNDRLFNFPDPKGIREWQKPPQPDRIQPLPMPVGPMPRPGGIGPTFPKPALPKPQPLGKMWI